MDVPIETVLGLAFVAGMYLKEPAAAVLHSVVNLLTGHASPAKSAVPDMVKQ